MRRLTIGVLCVLMLSPIVFAQTTGNNSHIQRAVAQLRYHSLRLGNLEVWLGQNRSDIVEAAKKANLVTGVTRDSKHIVVWAADKKMIGLVEFIDDAAVRITQYLNSFTEKDSGTAFAQRLCELLDMEAEQQQPILVQKAKASVRGELQEFDVEFGAKAFNKTVSYSILKGKVNQEGTQQLSSLVPSVQLMVAISIWNN